jgi:hypothetical protein
MTARNVIGVSLTAGVLALLGWFVATSPNQERALRMGLRDRPPAIACTWSQPWADPAYLMSGWSQPQPWWHEPGVKVLWSNARNAQILFDLPPGHTGRHVDIDIEYAAVSAPVEVVINDQRAGSLDLGATGDQDAHSFHYRLPTPVDGVIDVRFNVGDAVLHMRDGRYLGVLLKALRSCIS